MNDFISWEIKDSIIESSIINGTKKLGLANPVFIVDQFSGRAPMLVNENLLINKEVNYSIDEEALLDSNVVDLIDKFVNKQASTDGLNEFLKFVIEHGWNLNPLFYLLEHFSKSPIDNFKKNATRRLESIIKIFCMDEDHYLSENKFRITDKATQKYLIQCGEPSIQAAAVSWVNEFIDSYKNSWFSTLVEATEVVLIKMLLIRKVEMINACPSDQMKALESFCRLYMKVVMGRELHFSVLSQGFQEVRRAQISETVRLPKNKRYPKQTRHLEH
jgi:regulator of sigma D